MSMGDGGWVAPRVALAQNIVQSAWAAAALAFEPLQHVGITLHGKLLLDAPVLLAALCALLVFARSPG
jgi:hypothetical protein